MSACRTVMMRESQRHGSHPLLKTSSLQDIPQRIPSAWRLPEKRIAVYHRGHPWLAQ